MDYRYEIALERGPEDRYVPEDDEIHLALLGEMALADCDFVELRVIGDDTKTRGRRTLFVAEVTAPHPPLSAARTVSAIEALTALGYTIKWAFARIRDELGNVVDADASATFGLGLA